MRIIKKDSLTSRTYCFIDASNIIYGAKDEGWLAFSKKTSKDIKRFAKTNFIALENQKYLIERKPKKRGGP